MRAAVYRGGLLCIETVNNLESFALFAAYNTKKNSSDKYGYNLPRDDF